MVDTTDDWMNPSAVSSSWSLPKAEDKDEFIIERAKKQICFGNPGYIIEWHQWGVDYATARERDEAMRKLSDEHPMWHLRARTRNRWREQMGIFPPASVPGINN